MVMVQYRMECLFYGDWTVFLQNDENNCDMHEHALLHRDQNCVTQRTVNCVT